jgi:hypothetical protein
MTQPLGRKIHTLRPSKSSSPLSSQRHLVAVAAVAVVAVAAVAVAAVAVAVAVAGHRKALR